MEDMKRKVLDCIKEINKERDAQQAFIMERLGIQIDDLVVILNALYDEGLIIAKANKNKGKDQTLKHLDFIHIRAL